VLAERSDCTLLSLHSASIALCYQMLGLHGAVR